MLVAFAWDLMQEAAVDADQVYLAAIDKFDAMLSGSNTYAPEGLMTTTLVFAIFCGLGGCGYVCLCRIVVALQLSTDGAPHCSSDPICGLGTAGRR